MADNLQGLEKNFNDLLCPVLKGFVTGKARYPRYFEDFQFLDEKDASKMLSEIVSRIADEKLPLLYILIDEYDNFTNQLLTSFNDTLYEKVTTGDSFLRTFFKVIKGGIGGGGNPHVFLHRGVACDDGRFDKRLQYRRDSDSEAGVCQYAGL